MSQIVNFYRATKPGLNMLLVTEVTGQGYTLTGDFEGGIRHDFEALTNFPADKTIKVSLPDGDFKTCLVEILNDSTIFHSRANILKARLTTAFPWFFPRKPTQEKEPGEHWQAMNT